MIFSEARIDNVLSSCVVREISTNRGNDQGLFECYSQSRRNLNRYEGFIAARIPVIQRIGIGIHVLMQTWRIRDFSSIRITIPEPSIGRVHVARSEIVERQGVLELLAAVAVAVEGGALAN